jgi:hypothetical protein
MDMFGNKKIGELQQEIRRLEGVIRGLKDELGKSKKEVAIAWAAYHHRCGGDDTSQADIMAAQTYFTASLQISGNI